MTNHATDKESPQSVLFESRSNCSIWVRQPCLATRWLFMQAHSIHSWLGLVGQPPSSVDESWLEKVSRQTSHSHLLAHIKQDLRQSRTYIKVGEHWVTPAWVMGPARASCRANRHVLNI